MTNANTFTPIAYASLELQSPSLPSGIALGVVSNENGVYLFQDLPAGTYELWCAASGYTTFNQSGIEVATTEPAILNIPMNRRDGSGGVRRAEVVDERTPRARPG